MTKKDTCTLRTAFSFFKGPGYVYVYIVCLLCSVSRDEGALSEFSLVKGGDETQTMELLDDEFDRLIPQSGGEREESGEGGRGASSREEKEMAATRRAVRRVDPGMSVLQDSVLGMPADGMGSWGGLLMHVMCVVLVSQNLVCMYILYIVYNKVWVH